MKRGKTNPVGRIPKGFRRKAQGCEERATLGRRFDEVPTPTGLRVGGLEPGHNPGGVELILATIPQGSSFLATLGWRTQSRWDCLTLFGLPSRFAIRYSSFVIAIALALFATGCDWMPGKPKLAHRWAPDTAVTNFTELYNLHCAGCHAVGDGRLAASRPMDDPVYLAIVDPAAFRRAISNGVPGTAMPAFAQDRDGPLTEAQIEVVSANLLAKRNPRQDFTGVKLPPYSARPGDVTRGAAAYRAYCARCHGAEGKGVEKGGSVVNPSYLALVSDQGLRTTVIAGRADLGMPDWRGYVPGRPMSDDEIADVAAWLASHRNLAATSSGAGGLK